MCEEIYYVIGYLKYFFMSYKDSMLYLEVVFIEILRIGCIVLLFIFYGLIKELKYGQFWILDYVVFILNIYLVLFDLFIFECLELFNLERFFDDNGKFNGKEKYVVFFFLGKFLNFFFYKIMKIRY